MGIKGLLNYFSESWIVKTLDEYKNTTIGVDGHLWLHKLFFDIGEEFFYGKQPKTHVELFEKSLEKFTENKINLIFVFDGGSLPKKDLIIKKRQAVRVQKKNDVYKYLNQNMTEKAQKSMRKCYSVKDEHIYDVIQVLKRKNIEYMISPYEGDAQLCYLQKIKYIDYILTDDSDLIVYGCTNILYKLEDNIVKEYNASMLCEKFEIKEFDNCIDACILSGCDYLPSIRGVGVLKTAVKLMKEFGSPEAVILELSKTHDVSSTYKDDFVKARNIYKHQVVFDPVKKERVYLSGEKVHTSGVSFGFLGDINYPDAVGFAAGNHLVGFKGSVVETAIEEVQTGREAVGKQTIAKTQ